MPTGAQDVPPWGEPPKTIVYTDESLRAKLNEKLVYQAYVTDADWQARKFYPGNKLILKLKGEAIGEGQNILVEAAPMGRPTGQDGGVSGHKGVEAHGTAARRALPTEGRGRD